MLWLTFILPSMVAKEVPSMKLVSSLSILAWFSLLLQPHEVVDHIVRLAVETIHSPGVSFESILFISFDKIPNVTNIPPTRQ